MPMVPVEPPIMPKVPPIRIPIPLFEPFFVL